MDWLKNFSDNYANAVTAVAATVALATAVITLLYLRREFRAKYRPYVVPLMNIETIEVEPGKTEFHINIQPTNVGPHPCKIKVSSIELQIGDELFITPSHDLWTLIGAQGVGYRFAAGHINQIGIQNIRDARYTKNRVEIRFRLHSRSIEDEHEEMQPFLYELELRGPQPSIIYRPDLINNR
jgi:hypothetical protein